MVYVIVFADFFVRHILILDRRSRPIKACEGRKMMSGLSTWGRGFGRVGRMREGAFIINLQGVYSRLS